MLLMALTLIFPMAMVMAMVSDVRDFEIPNSLPLLLLVAYPLTALIAGFSWQQIFWAFSLSGLMLAIAIILFLLRIMGGGDGKLLAASVLWIGQERLWEFLFMTTLAGGVLALALMLFRRLPLASALKSIATIEQLHARKQDIPYAVAIGCAGLIIYPHLPVLNC
jgi:prepilin peptidase CpaA